MQQGEQALIEGILGLLDRMMREMRHPLPREWVEQDLTLPPLRVLALLQSGPRRVGDVASHLGVSLPTASGIVDRLVAKGLVGRYESPQDRRAVECALTPAGEALVERSVALRRSRVEAVLRRLSPEDLEAVWRALQALYRATEAVCRQGDDTQEE